MNKEKLQDFMIWLVLLLIKEDLQTLDIMLHGVKLIITNGLNLMIMKLLNRTLMIFLNLMVEVIGTCLITYYIEENTLKNNNILFIY